MSRPRQTWVVKLTHQKRSKVEGPKTGFSPSWRAGILTVEIKRTEELQLKYQLHSFEKTQFPGLRVSTSSGRNSLSLLNWLNRLETWVELS